jgi:nucleoside triphosphate pyrophosphatase
MPDERMRLVLASASPQRKAILEQLGIEFTVQPAAVEELSAGEPHHVVVENARRKARAVEGELVLACDTEVILDGHVFGKPADEVEARTFLGRLSGRTHDVYGGIVLRRGGAEQTGVCVTKVRFRALEAREIDAYVATGEWRERAGGYAIQGRGAALVRGIRGDYLNVVGLPVQALLDLLPGLVVPR